MPPKFNVSSFKFENDQDIPEHIEGYPVEAERDQSKFWLQGQDSFEGSFYTLAIDIDDLPTAQVLLSARQSQVRKTQSGEGMQDRAVIRGPQMRD